MPVELSDPAALPLTGSEGTAPAEVATGPKAPTRRAPRPRYRRNSPVNRSIKPSPLKAGGPRNDAAPTNIGGTESVKPGELGYATNFLKREKRGSTAIFISIFFS